MDRAHIKTKMKLLIMDLAEATAAMRKCGAAVRDLTGKIDEVSMNEEAVEAQLAEFKPYLL